MRLHSWHLARTHTSLGAPSHGVEMVGRRFYFARKAACFLWRPFPLWLECVIAHHLSASEAKRPPTRASSANTLSERGFKTQPKYLLSNIRGLHAPGT